MKERQIPTPPRTPETEAFWEAAQQGRFVLRFCKQCQKTHWYPRAICPHCFSDDTEWREASGRGIIYSYSIMRRVEVPYAIAYVTLDEGPTMMTNIVDSDFDHLAIGKRVTLVFKPSEGGQPVPVFRLE